MTAVRHDPAEGPLRGTISVPSDKAISHRAALLAAVAVGESRIRRFSPAGDCRSTLGVLRTLGVHVRLADGELRVHGGALPSLAEGAGADGGRPHLATEPIRLDCGRSGTTMRLTMGLVAPLALNAIFDGDPQLRARPMGRVTEPLKRMGAQLETAADGRPPVALTGQPLHAIAYELPVASAQVKSALLLAGLNTSGTTTIVEPVPTRDHSERLLAAMGAHVTRKPGCHGLEIGISAGTLHPLDLLVPGDISSAAPLCVAAAIVPNSLLRITDVGLNPTRLGLIDVLVRMGAEVTIEEREGGIEPLGTITVRQRPLQATTISEQEIPALVDELPLIAVLATQAQGATEVRGAGELRLKESDRIAGIVAGLQALGADVSEREDGFVVRGPTPLRGGSCDARDDHRLAMAFAVAALVARAPVQVAGAHLTGDSFPGFTQVLAEALGATG